MLTSHPFNALNVQRKKVMRVNLVGGKKKDKFMARERRMVSSVKDRCFCLVCIASARGETSHGVNVCSKKG